MMKAITIAFLVLLLHVIPFILCAAEVQLPSAPGCYPDKGVCREPVADDVVLHTRYLGLLDGTRWLLICGREILIPLEFNLSAMCQVHQLSASPRRDQLAVLSSGEGHPVIEVVDLLELVDRKHYQVLRFLNPYPGVVAISGWESGALIVWSDVRLCHKDGEVKAVSPDFLQEPVEYVWNLSSGEIGERHSK